GWQLDVRIAVLGAVPLEVGLLECVARDKALDVVLVRAVELGGVHAPALEQGLQRPDRLPVAAPALSGCLVEVDRLACLGVDDSGPDDRAEAHPAVVLGL